MKKNKFTEKLKEGISVEELENFARKHMTEVISVLALTIAMISSVFDFFTGPSWTIIFTALGAILGIFFPTPVERGLKQLYDFTFKQEKSTQMILGGVKLVIAIFIPFILFGIVGLLAGTSYHYYTRHAQVTSETQSSHSSYKKSEDEHD